MITACQLNEDDKIVLTAVAPGDALPADVIWLDVNQPDDTERE